MPLISADLKVQPQPCIRRMPHPTNTVGYIQAPYNAVREALGEAVVPVPGGGVEWVIETPAGQAILFDRESPFNPQRERNTSADWQVWAHYNAVMPWIHQVIAGDRRGFPTDHAPAITLHELITGYVYYLHHRALALPPGGVLATQLILQRNDLVDILIRYERGTGILSELPEPSAAADPRLHRATAALRQMLHATRRYQDDAEHYAEPRLADLDAIRAALADKADNPMGPASMREVGLHPDHDESAAHRATIQAIAATPTQPSQGY